MRQCEWAGGPQPELGIGRVNLVLRDYHDDLRHQVVLHAYGMSQLARDTGALRTTGGTN